MGEILTVDNVSFSYKNKYQTGLTEDICPAVLPKSVTEQLQNTAEKVYQTLKLDAYARIDFILDSESHFYCLEANTLPGMTPTSLLPQEALAVGISYDELVEILVDESLKKYN